ncbi:MAG: hypothetical protein RLZZ620_803, partial [Pseudomonadota bacterium]
MENANTQDKPNLDEGVKDAVFVAPKASGSWSVLSYVLLILSVLTGMAAFLAERHWVNEDRYANAISAEQAIAVKLPFVLKDLADQINRPHPFETAWFASLKKSNKDLKQFLDQVQIVSKPKEAAKDPEAPVEPKPSSFFGALDGLAHSIFSALDESVKPSVKEPVVAVPDPQAIPVLNNASDVIAVAAIVDTAVTTLTNQELELNNIKVLAQALAPFMAPSGILDLTKTPEDSPLYKMAVSADAFIKASKAWQINVTD